MTENRFRNRGFNLSYRDRLLEQEILRGRMVASEHDPNSTRPVEISVEQKYAESLDLDLGDQLEIEVEGAFPGRGRQPATGPLDQLSAQLLRPDATGSSGQGPKTFIGTLNNILRKSKERPSRCTCG